jgi:hypothetical protein
VVWEVVGKSELQKRDQVKLEIPKSNREKWKKNEESRNSSSIARWKTWRERWTKNLWGVERHRMFSSYQFSSWEKSNRTKNCYQTRCQLQSSYQLCCIETDGDLIVETSRGESSENLLSLGLAIDARRQLPWFAI